ncbi:MAG: TRAP transporter substrate-binding protein DctP, partial [Chitinivibrionales bacterium]
MLKPLKATFVSCFILSLCIQVHAYTIKMGTIAPDGSPWSKALKKISSEWNNISDGKINIKIYDGGIAGDEEDMLRKMRIGQLHAAALSGVGFVRIYNGVLALQLPMLIRNDKELYYVLEKLKDHYESKIKKEGFIVLAWSKVGWVHFFSKNPVVTPDDLREHKLFT